VRSTPQQRGKEKEIRRTGGATKTWEIYVIPGDKEGVKTEPIKSKKPKEQWDGSWANAFNSKIFREGDQVGRG